MAFFARNSFLLMMMLLSLLAKDSLNASTIYAPVQNCCGSEEVYPEQYGFFLRGELLFWYPTQPNLEYTHDVTKTGNFFDSDLEITEGPGKVYFLEPGMNWGYRLTGGFRWICNGWDLLFSYTDVRGHDRTTTVPAPGGNMFLAGSWVQFPQVAGEEPIVYVSAEAKHEFEYRTYDLHFRHNLCFLYNSLAISPQFGVRVLEFDQDREAIYVSDEFGQESLGRKVTSSVDFHSYYRGVGLHGSLSSEYQFCSCVGIYSMLGTSLVVGNTDNRREQNDKLLLQGVEFNETSVDLKDKECLVVPGIQLGLGVDWERCLNNTMYLRFRLGYEMVMWWNLPQQSTFLNNDTGNSLNGTSGALGFHGLTVLGEVNF